MTEEIKIPGTKAVRGGAVSCLILALPLLAAGAWLTTLGLGYGTFDMIEGWIAALAFTGFVTLLARWRMFGPASWPCAWLLYLAGLVVTLADALAWYFQGGSFSVRFFANARLDNMLIGLHAFPNLSYLTLLVLLGMLVISAWLLWRDTGSSGRRERGNVARMAVLAVLALAASLPSSPWQRLGGFIVHYRHNQSLVRTDGTRDSGLLADPHPVPRDVVRAAPGKNLVIIYMESLERIYTDNKVFPGLTPNLNRWRAKSLDYSGFLTFTGADYTIAGLFASQCGAPYLPSPVRALALGGNDANATSFQPSLACLGDVLHAAGYRQVFMNGVNLSFASVGDFFRLHGYDQVLGLEQLEDADGHELPHPGWGLYDSELFRLAVKKFDKLAASGRPFNLNVLTIDNHPPHGRPSPGCPAYTANDNSVLQAVHCTDHLVGKFLDAISASPAWKNTVVVVMSDHQSMRNDAWPLYPDGYQRRPLLFILNAGQGRRDMRFYHMDIAPTVLDLMRVRTNATFLAGADRGAADAPDSPLVNNPTDVAALKHALWARAQPLKLCQGGVLLGAADNGIRVGGYHVPMSRHGRRRIGLRLDDTWLVRIGTYSAHGRVLEKDEVSAALAGGSSDESAWRKPGLHYRPSTVFGHRPGESTLLVKPLTSADPSRQFSVDWIGKSGGRTHLADVPRLRGLQIESTHCAALLSRMNALQSGKTLDLHEQFQASTAQLYPLLSGSVWFNKPEAQPFKRERGWVKPEQWGDFSIGDSVTLGFRLPKDHCHAMNVAFKVHPFIHKLRPVLKAAVFVNGTLVTTWRFDKSDTGKTWRRAVAPVHTQDPRCTVDLRFVFSRPGASPPPYPKGEDPRPLQLLFLKMTPAPVAGAVVANR